MIDILFIPGLNCTGALFALQIKGLEGMAECHVADHTTADTIPAIARHILSKAPEGFVLVGLSMGGYIAQEILRQAPERVRGLALLDTRASLDTPAETQTRKRTIALAEQGRFNQLHDLLWPRLVHPARLGDQALESLVKSMMQETGAAGFIRQQKAVMHRADYEPYLQQIKVPSLVLVGAQDAITPPHFARVMQDAIAGSHYVEIADCGHLASLEAPAIVTQALIDVLLKPLLAKF